MNLYLLIEKTTLNAYQWTLRGIFNSDKIAYNAAKKLLDKPTYADKYFVIREIDSNELNESAFGYLYGFEGIPGR